MSVQPMSDTPRSQALEAIADHLEALEAALADPDWDGTLLPAVDLRNAADLGVQQLAAAHALLERVTEAHAQLAQRMATVRSELKDMDARRDASRAYITNDLQV
jgi:hypothetical protein